MDKQADTAADGICPGVAGATQISKRVTKRRGNPSSVLLEASAYQPTKDFAEKLRSKAPVPHQLLPPQLKHHKGKKCLVLDLDETLVHSSTAPDEKSDFSVQVVINAVEQKVYVMKRPGCQRFLEHLSEKFELVVFTASLARYADAVLDVIDPKGLIWWRLYRDSCTSGCGQIQGQFVKDLSALGRPANGTVLLDNSPSCYSLQPNQGIPIANFFDDPKDTHLLDLLPMLDKLAECDDVQEFVAQHWPKIVDADKKDEPGLVTPHLLETADQSADSKRRSSIQPSDLLRAKSSIQGDTSVPLLTPARLHAAAIAGDDELVEVLIDGKVNVNTLDMYGCSVLQRAAFGGHVPVVKALISAKAFVDSKLECVQDALAWASLEAPCYSYDPHVLETSDGDRTTVMSDRAWVVSAIKATQEKNMSIGKSTKEVGRGSVDHPMIKRRCATPPSAGGPCSSACVMS